MQEMGDTGSTPEWEDVLEEEMVTYSSIFAWENPQTEEPGGLQLMGSEKSGTQLGDHAITTTGTVTLEVL